MLERRLIVNADDFGLSPGVNRGIARAHEHGIVTSASLMVRWPAAAEAAAYARSRPQLSVGLHVDLGEWTCRDGEWVLLYEVVPTQDGAAVAAEVGRQLDAFARLMGRPPTHLDSHQHVHLHEPVRSILAEAAQRYGVPLRSCSPEVQYCGDFYGQTTRGAPYLEGISVEGLIRTLCSLPPGLTELACHPGDGTDLDTMYRHERAAELRTLCAPAVRAVIAAEGIELGSFQTFLEGMRMLRDTLPVKRPGQCACGSAAGATRDPVTPLHQESSAPPAGRVASNGSSVGVQPPRASAVQEPLWVQTQRRPALVRIFNAVVGGLRRLGVHWPRPDVEAMLAVARRRTGLSDFGDGRFREGLQVLVDSFNAQDTSHAFGRFAFRAYCTGLLINRLRIQADLARHPEILEVPIRRPLFITGLPRSGTTLLQRLLSQAPTCRALLQWEAVEPSPPPRRETRATDPRIERARRLAAMTYRLAPGLAAAHETGAESPEEDNILFAHAFQSGVVGILFDAPAFLRWFLKQDHVWSCRYVRQLLQLLSWQCPGEYWVLKDPSHLFKLDALLTVFPDACIVMTHRNPLRVVPSACSLLAGLKAIFANRLDLRRHGEECLEVLGIGSERAIATRARSDPARFFDVSYDRLLADPVGTVHDICRHFGHDFDPDHEDRVRRWLAENPQHKHGVHRYQLEDFGLDAATVERSFVGYRKWLAGQRLEVQR